MTMMTMLEKLSIVIDRLSAFRHVERQTNLWCVYHLLEGVRMIHSPHTKRLNSQSVWYRYTP